MLANVGSIPDQDEAADPDAEADCGCAHRQDKSKNKDRRGKPELDEKPKAEGILGRLGQGIKAVKNVAVNRTLGRPDDYVPGVHEPATSKAKRRAGGKNSVPHPRGKSRAESFHVRNALGLVQDVLEGGKGSLREAVDGLMFAVYEADCGPIRHYNKKTGECVQPGADLQKSMKSAHELSKKARTPQGHEQALAAHERVAHDLSTAGFHQLGGLHAARAKQHRLATAFN